MMSVSNKHLYYLPLCDKLNFIRQLFLYVVYFSLNRALILIFKLQDIKSTSNFEDERKERNLSVIQITQKSASTALQNKLLIHKQCFESYV